MKHETCLACITRHWTYCMLAAALLIGCQAERAPISTDLVRYGGMHETIGQGDHHGRIALAEIVDRPHFYGVGAVEGLRGEITIQDSVAIVTGVTPDTRPQPLAAGELQATLLVGQSMDEWTSLTLTHAVSHDRFDETIATAAAESGLSNAAPFMFVVDGEFTDIRLHVINGACPVHARMKNLALDESERPYELEASSLTGTLIGVYAPDSVGKLTHPATSIHAHLIYAEDETNQRITGHLERVGLAPGAVLTLPQPRAGHIAAAGR